MNTIEVVALTVTAGLLLWDLTLYVRGKQTITQYMIEASKKHIWIPFAWGCLMGHFFL